MKMNLFIDKFNFTFDMHDANAHLNIPDVFPELTLEG